MFSIISFTASFIFTIIFCASLGGTLGGTIRAYNRHAQDNRWSLAFMHLTLFVACLMFSVIANAVCFTRLFDNFYISVSVGFLLDMFWILSKKTLGMSVFKFLSQSMVFALCSMILWNRSHIS